MLRRNYRLPGRLSQWIALLVAVHGLRIIAGTLVSQFTFARFPRISVDIGFVLDVPLLVGLGLLYLSLSLWRRKYTAWVLACGLYVFLLGLMTRDTFASFHGLGSLENVAILALPMIILAILWLARKEFVVRSDIRTFAWSIRVAIVVLATALLYGVIGYLLMDVHDFHQEIPLSGAIHYTIDQFDLTTSPLQAYTRRARLFQDSLSFISISAIGFVAVSLFQPIKARYIHHKEHLEAARRLTHEYAADSEDFFKLWPQDKAYVFGPANRSVIAYKVQRGIALTVGDPLVEPKEASKLLRRFEELCFVNGWRPAFVHVTPKWKRRLAVRGYQLQPIGREAVVDVAHFAKEVAPGKYFRQIAGRFSKLGYTAELLTPPHHEAILDRLRIISEEWLARPGKVERGFMMGYFSPAYLQQCRLFVARDAAGTIQVFLNLVPSPVPGEANYDMLRSSKNAPGNSNDFLLLSLLARLNEDKISHLNLGLCPLAGLEYEPSTLINRTLHFVYSSGDRLYSFRGLYRFKAKYQPEWSARYIAYQGSSADFTQVMAALNAAMKV